MSGSLHLNQNIEVVIKPVSRSPWKALAEVMTYRHLLFYLGARFIQARYIKTLLGWPWLFLRPLLPTLIATFVFGTLLGAPSEDIPYPVFYLAGVSVWNLFSNSLTFMTRSLAMNRRLVTKIYFPRMIIPIAALAPFLLEFLINMLLLAAFFIFYTVHDGTLYMVLDLRLLLSVFFILMAALFALGIGFWTSVLNSQARDVRFTLPYFLQLCSFLTPVIYPLSHVPEKWRFLALINPMTQAVEGFKWSVLGAGTVNLQALAISTAVIGLTLASGMWFFHRVETKFVDNL